MSKTAFYFTGNNQCNTVLVVFQNEEAKFLTMVFVFLCACLLFFYGRSDGLAYFFGNTTNPGLKTNLRKKNHRYWKVKWDWRHN